MTAAFGPREFGPRGFETAEYRDRLTRAQRLMADRGLGALFLTTEPEIRYFTGFLTRFWDSPTRPWFLIVPADRDPIAVIPAIGADLMAKSWITDIRTWDAPDYDDDGVRLLNAAFAALDGPVGVPSGLETHLRMPLNDYARLTVPLTHDHGIMARLRAVKSPAEIAKIRTACTIANRAFARVPEIAQTGAAVDHVARSFQSLCLEEGADWVGYLAVGHGPGGYGDVISLPAQVPLTQGDVLMLDTGVVWDGYYCDFDRNFAVGPTGAEPAHARLIDATQAAFDHARPGVTAATLFHQMDQILTGGAAPPGRLGHGLGLQLTEGLSLISADHTVLEPGMVLTLEPSIATGPGRLLVHEENIVITETGAEYLSDPAVEMADIA